MSLTESLDAFYLEHRLCGQLRANVEDGPEMGQWRVWMECDQCGVWWERREVAV
jgi:hypothetical protein